ncbi:MAG TPA: hypothetical protein VIJ14_04105 [Rhabdochlamydiaceae bacterium]
MSQKVTGISSLPQGKNTPTTDPTRPMLAIDPLNELLFETVDEVVQDELEKSQQNAVAPTLQGRVSDPSTPPRQHRISRLLDPQTPSDDDETGDSVSQRSNQSSPGFTTSSEGLNKSQFGFVTPESSPHKTAPKKTPDSAEAEQSLRAIIDDHHPGYDLSPDSKDAFQGALRKVKQWQSPHKAKDSVRRYLGAALEQTGAATEVPSPALLGRRLIFATHNCDDIMGDWTTRLAKDLRFSFLDAKHLEDLEDNGGFHICGADHPRDRWVILRRTNLMTGVWCGRVCEEGRLNEIRKKFSSFVPRKMNLEHYQSLIAAAINTPACKIAQQSNRRLYRVVDGNNSFVVECYIQEEGTRIRSAMPVFHYEVWNGKDNSFQVHYSYKWSLADNDPLINCVHEVVYAQLFDLLKRCPDAIVYETDDKIIVDVGLLYNSEFPKYGRCPIDQGLLVEISKKLL